MKNNRKHRKNSAIKNGSASKGRELDRIKSKNPNVKKLIERLDLVLIKND